MIKTSKTQTGAAILLLALALLLVTTFVGFFMVSTNMSAKTAINHLYQTKRAYTNAESGLQYALSYLKKNKSKSSLLPIKTENFTVKFKKTTANHHQIITVISTGFSDNKNITRKIEQQVFFNSINSLATVPGSWRDFF